MRQEADRPTSARPKDSLTRAITEARIWVSATGAVATRDRACSLDGARSVRAARHRFPGDLVVLTGIPQEPARCPRVVACFDFALDVVGAVRRRLVPHRLQPRTDLRATIDAAFRDRLFDVLHSNADE